MLNGALDLPLALLANYPEFPDSSLSVQLTLLVHIADVLADGAQILTEQLCHLLLGEPDRLTFQTNLHRLAGVLENHYDTYAASSQPHD